MLFDKYYSVITFDRQSLLARIYGVFEFNINKLHYNVVLFQNVFSGMPNALKFDLKGSEANRRVS